MSARSKHRWRLATAWATVAALLFHVAVLVVPATVRAADGLGNSVILCSSFGMSSVALADLTGDQVPDQVPEKGSAPVTSFFCPICSAAHLAGTALPPAETILPAPNARPEVIAVSRDERAVAILRMAGSGPRAPPAVA